MDNRGALKHCLQSIYNREDINRLIEVCYTQALSYLKIKSASHKAYLIRDENIEDLAWDFIAELFQKDEQGNLTAFQKYFEAFELTELSETDIKIELRKLVFTKVDDSIFRFYGEKDPSLRKIIRNIKLAVKELNSKSEVCYEDGLICAGHEALVPTKPMIPSEFLQIKLCLFLNDKMQIPDIVSIIISILKEQSTYQKKVSLVEAATIIRESYVLLQHQNGKEDTFMNGEMKLFDDEIDAFLDQSVSKVKQKVGQHYVKKGKLPSEQVDNYFEAATNIVKNDFKQNDSGLSQYDEAKKYVGDLEYEQYRSKHRPVLEYVVKLIREDLVHAFKKEWARF